MKKGERCPFCRDFEGCKNKRLNADDCDEFRWETSMRFITENLIKWDEWKSQISKEQQQELF